MWEHKEWPGLTWDENSLYNLIATVAHEQGRIQGKMEVVGFDLRSEAHLITRTEDVVKSSEIEGEYLDSDQVRSSVARRLGLEVSGFVQASQQVDSVVEMMLDATENYDEPLNENRLSSWHTALFPSGFAGMGRIKVGCWRDDQDGPMQVVSGPIGQEKVHYETVPASRIEVEMSRFLNWFENPKALHPLLVASLAHLWFLTIHPFDDGNGRIARTLADMALARSEKFG